MKFNTRLGLINLRNALAEKLSEKDQITHATEKTAIGTSVVAEIQRKYKAAPAQPAFKEGASADPLATFQVIIGAAEPNKGNNKIT